MTKPTAAANARGLPEEIRSSAYELVIDIERPLGRVRAVLIGLELIAENLGSDADEAVQALASLARDQCVSIEQKRSELFRLLHPSRRHFEMAGRPGALPASEVQS